MISYHYRRHHLFYFFCLLSREHAQLGVIFSISM